MAGYATDAPRQPSPLPSRLEQLLPASALPYAHLMRLEKPIGSWLLAWPGFWCAVEFLYCLHFEKSAGTPLADAQMLLAVIVHAGNALSALLRLEFAPAYLVYAFCRSIALAAPLGHLPDLQLLAYFGVGAIVSGAAALLTPSPNVRRPHLLDMACCLCLTL